MNKLIGLLLLLLILESIFFIIYIYNHNLTITINHQININNLQNIEKIVEDLKKIKIIDIF